MSQVILMLDKTDLGKGSVLDARSSSNVTGRNSIQAGILGTGAVSATVKIYGMNDGRFPTEIATITLTGTGSAWDATDDIFPWEFYQAEITAISGTGARVTVVAST